MMESKHLDETLSALADPTRRGVVELLSGEPSSATEIARRFGLSLPAMSRHLRVLRRIGLIEHRPVEEDARIRMYRLRREGFFHLSEWTSGLGNIPVNRPGDSEHSTAAAETLPGPL